MQFPHLLDLKTLQAEVQRIEAHCQAQSRPASLGLGEPAELLSEGPIVHELQHWVAVIARSFGYRVSDFALAFADGSLLCRLVSRFQILSRHQAHFEQHLWV